MSDLVVNPEDQYCFLALWLIRKFCLQLRSDVEEHLDVTIDVIEPDMKVPINEFDGKVTYGQRRKLGGTYSVK